MKDRLLMRRLTDPGMETGAHALGNAEGVPVTELDVRRGVTISKPLDCAIKGETVKKKPATVNTESSQISS